LLFDLDGTLIDSVYQHVLAWHEALEQVGISLAVWQIHRRIGMSGGLLMQALVREVGHKVSVEQAEELQELHAVIFARYRESIRALPGARELLRYLNELKIPHAIGTSGKPKKDDPALLAPGVGPEVPIITRREVA
jgi:beta-phosphoglucomutase-like phosphatase (HAD superfamily)